MPLIVLFSFFLGAIIGTTIAIDHVKDSISLEPAENALYLKQRPLSAAAHEVLMAIPATERMHGGYAGIQLAEDAVELWWKGELSPPLKSAIDVISKVVPVRVMAANFSLAELEDAAAPLRQYIRDPANAFHTVALPFDGSKVIVYADMPKFALPLDMAEVMPMSLREPANQVPIVFDHGPPPMPQQRYSDAPPWEGGIAICHDRSRCTSGFPVTNEFGESFLLTAAHCGNEGTNFHTCDTANNNVKYIGTGRYRWTEHDFVLVRADGMNGAIWDGDLGGGFMKGVAYWSDVFGGEYVCQSGTTSGVVCGIRIEQTGVSYCFENSFCMRNMVKGKKDGGTAIRGGDSGGPVFVPWNNGKVIAKGINSARSNNANDMYFGKFFDANRQWKLNVVTG